MYYAAAEQRASKRSKVNGTRAGVEQRAPSVTDHSTSADDGDVAPAAAPTLAQLQQRHMELFGVETCLEDADALRALLTDATTTGAPFTLTSLLLLPALPTQARVGASALQLESSRVHKPAPCTHQHRGSF